MNIMEGFNTGVKSGDVFEIHTDTAGTFEDDLEKIKELLQELSRIGCFVVKIQEGEKE